MKIHKEFVLRQVADTWVVLPLGQDTVSFNGVLTLNNSGAKLWDLLEKGADEKTLVRALMDAFDVETQQAEEDVQSFLDVLEQAGCIGK